MLIKATPHKRRVGGSRKNNTSVHNLDAAKHGVETTAQQFKSLLGAVTLLVGVLRRKTVAIEGSLNPGRASERDNLRLSGRCVGGVWAGQTN